MQREAKSEQREVAENEMIYIICKSKQKMVSNKRENM